MQTVRQQLTEFCAAMGIQNPTTPGAPHPEIVRKSLRLVAEEFFELLEASSLGDFETERELVMKKLDVLCVDVDLVETADALADIAYVTEAAFQSFGINSEPVMAEVHRTNMLKTGGKRREDGKILKPDGWLPPDIEGVLVAQLQDDL